MRTLAIIAACLSPLLAAADDMGAMRESLALHATFDGALRADFSRGDSACMVRQGSSLVPSVPNAEVQIVAGAGRFGGALHFPKKGATRQQFTGTGVLGYNAQSWSATVSLWLRLSPDQDLEPGYCDPVQIVGDDSKKGFIFLEWSKDETPRFFCYAVRPLFHIWNPDGVQWADIPFEKRPMVQVAKAPFHRDRWTHVAFTISKINEKGAESSGALYLDGVLQGRIEKWDLSFGWDPEKTALVLGAAYVGSMDDLAVFDRALSDTEIQQLFRLPGGVHDLR